MKLEPNTFQTTYSINFLVPEAILQRVDLPSETLTSLRGVVQLPLQLPAGGVGPGGLLLCFFQLTLQLLHARVGFFHLTAKSSERLWVGR